MSRESEKGNSRPLDDNEKELWETNDVFRSITEESPDPIFIVNQQGRYLYVNKAATTLLGYTRDELVSMSISDLIPEERMEESMDIFHRTLKDGESFCEIEMKRKDGSLVPTYINTRVLPNGLIYGNCRDISERKKAREELKAQQRLLERITENYPNTYLSIIEKDLTTGYSAGQEFKKQGLDPKDFLGLSLESVFGTFGEEVLATVKENYLKAFQGEEQIFELFINNQYQLYKAIPLPDENGQIERIMVVVENITVQKKAEEELKAANHLLEARNLQLKVSTQALVERKRYFRTLLYAIHEDISVIDSNYRIVDLNNTTQIATGRTREEIIGRKCFTTSHGYDRPCDEHGEKCLLKEVFETGEPRNCHHMHVHSDGTKVHVDILLSPMKNENGDVTYVVEAVRDVSDIVQTQEMLLKEQSRAQQYLDIAGTVFVAINEKGEVTLVNQKGCEVLGYPEEEILGKNWFENFIPERLQEELIPLSRQLLAGEIETAKYHENPILTKAGEERTMAWHNTIVKDKEGNIIGHLSSGTDITERKQAEEEIRKSKVLLESSIESPKDMIILSLDREYRYLYFNKTHGESMGHIYGSRPQIGDCIFDHMKGKEDIAKVKAHYDQAMGGEEHVATEEYGEGQERHYYEIRYSPIYDENNDIIGVTAFAQNITERKKAMEDIEKLAKFPAENPNPVLRISREGTITFANKASEPLLKRWNCQAGEGLSDEWKQFPDSALNAGKPQRTEVSCGDKVFLVSYAPVQDSGFVNVYGLDITERKRTEEALKKSEERLRTIIDHSNEMFYIHDTENILFYVSPQCEQMFGYSQEEMMRSWTELTTDNPMNEQGLQHTMRAFETGERQPPYLLELLRKDGSRILGEVKESPVKDENGTVLGMAGMLMDVSEAKKAEETLRKREQQYRTIMNSSLQGMFQVDAGGHITFANPATAELTGYSLEELDGLSLDILFPRGEARAISDANVKLLYSGQSITGENTLTRKDGSIIETYFSCAPLLDENGEFTGFVGSILDITERKKAEEERKKMEANLQETMRMESLGKLAGNVAHDFNNLLTGIMSNAEFALRKLAPMSPGKHHIEDIDSTANKAKELANQMLNYSGKGRFQEEDLSLNELVEEMTHLLEVAISKGIVLKYNFADNLPAVKGDASQLGQVVLNLITNASEAIGKKSGFISVTTGLMDCDRAYLDEIFLAKDIVEGSYIYLEVADTGCGMDPATVARIFEPYFSTKFTGRGLGLAGVQGIVKGHGGTIKVYSEPGKGTTFKVLLPALDRPAGKRAMVEAKDEQDGWQAQGTILVVDDEPSIRAVCRAALKGKGFEVLTANDGLEGVEAFRKHRDDIVCVILDLTMPRMGGEECFRELRRIKADVKVILSSGYNEQSVTNQFVGKGLAGFIQKPYRPSDLEEKVREILGL